MTKYSYFPSKVRFLIDGKWEDWRFEAYSLTNSNPAGKPNFEMGKTAQHRTIDELAKELASYELYSGGSKFFQFPPSDCPTMLLPQASSRLERASQRSYLSENELAMLITSLRSHTPHFGD